MKGMVLLLATFFLATTLRGQDVPLFSQKLTNAFIYNPAFAGNSLGSLTLSHRTNYSGVQGGPVGNYFSLQAPFSNYRYGVGFNYYQEDVNILKNSYLSGAFAYHVHFNKLKTLSMGVSGEYNATQLKSVPELSTDDLTLQRYSFGQTTPDFSFGLVYQSRFVKFGLAANRLSTTWLSKTKTLTNYYSGFVQGLIPLCGGLDLLEPYLAYRKSSPLTDTYDIGLYYTYDKKMMAGAATRKGSVFSATLAYKINRNILVGYSREIIFGTEAGFAGASNEFTLRFDFKDQGYRERVREDYKSSLAVRRKFLLTETKKMARGNFSPKAIKKAMKKMAPYSPTKRYQDIKRLTSRKKRPKINRNKTIVFLKSLL